MEINEQIVKCNNTTSETLAAAWGNVESFNFNR